MAAPAKQVRPKGLQPVAPPVPAIKNAAARRRTFAITSHLDVGKTTLTEKLLLFGGARSDWMRIEQQRGISVTTFEYARCTFNLLDAAGHEDFSEDCHRHARARMKYDNGRLRTALV